jgi:hypothetical protein
MSQQLATSASPEFEKFRVRVAVKSIFFAPHARAGPAESSNATNPRTIIVKTLCFFIIPLLSDRQLRFLSLE